jgi:DNA-binding transcriptional ArsR family regulator
MRTLKYIGPTVFSKNLNGRFLMKGTYLCVPTNWACDITRCVTQSAIPEITKKLEENGIVIDERDRHNVFKLFEIEYVGYMSGTLRKGDKALLYWQDLDPEYDEGLALIIGEYEEEKDYDRRTSLGTLRLIRKLGYSITRSEGDV